MEWQMQAVFFSNGIFLTIGGIFWGLPASHVHSQQNKKYGLIKSKKGEGNTNCNLRAFFFSSGSV